MRRRHKETEETEGEEVTQEGAVDDVDEDVTMADETNDDDDDKEEMVLPAPTEEDAWTVRVGAWRRVARTVGRKVPTVDAVRTLGIFPPDDAAVAFGWDAADAATAAQV